MGTERQKRIVHIAGDALLASTGYSQQFFIETRQLAQEGYHVSVVAFCHLKFFLGGNRIKNLVSTYRKAEINIYPVPTLLLGKCLLELLFAPIAFLVVLCLRFLWKITIFHVHVYYMSLFVLPLKLLSQVTVINDIHGVAIEERLYRKEIKPDSFIQRYEDYKERIALKCADFNLCVSRRMVEHYVRKHGVSEQNFRITRSSYDPSIFFGFSYRKKEEEKQRLQLSGKTVIIHMGHNQSWQQTDRITSLFVQLKKRISDAYFVCLTNDADAVLSVLDGAGISNSDYMVGYVDHEKVAQYSFAADVAVLIRDNSIVNRVASPVKFSEYLASGLAVLLSDNIGDLASIVTQNRIGYVLGSDIVCDGIIEFMKAAFRSREDRKVIAERCAQVAEREFSVESTMRTFRDIYTSKET